MATKTMNPTTEATTPKATTSKAAPKVRATARIPQDTFFNISLDSVENTTKHPVEKNIDNVLSAEVLYDVDKSTVVCYTLHSKPSFGVQGIDDFNELVFTRTIDMPKSFFAIANVWNHTLLEFRRAHRGMGWVAMKVSHESDLMPILVRHGFIPATADDNQTQIVIAFLASGKDSLAADDKVSVNPNDKVIEVENSYGRVVLSGHDIELNSSEKVSNSEVSIDALGVEFSRLSVFKIQKHPAPHTSFYRSYETLARLLKCLGHQMRKDASTAMGVIASNRLEAIACLEAGFFPVDYNGEGDLYIRTR